MNHNTGIPCFDLLCSLASAAIFFGKGLNMRCILSDANVFRNGRIERTNVGIIDGILNFQNVIPSSGDLVISCHDYTVFPGFADVHVHFREPGFSYKETIKSGTKAAAHGGYTSVCTMPNLIPSPDDLASLAVQTEIIHKDAVIHVYPYGTITRGEKGDTLSDLEDMASHVAGFSDDGHGVQNDEMMETAMREARRLNKIIVAHCEDNTLLHGGYIHEGSYAAEHHHKGICSESEWGQIKRDLELVRKTGCAYHVCHISTKESVELIRQAKKEGLDVTCETGPHYLLLNDSMMQEEGRFKMNPPIRSEEDRQALLEGLRDGTIDMIATDHAPHSENEKARGLKESLMGVVGIETAFPLLYTYLVCQGEISLEKLIGLLCVNPRMRFGLDCGMEEGRPANITIFDLNAQYTIDPGQFLSMGRSTPFVGWQVSGKCIATISEGEFAYRNPGFAAEENG